MAFQAPQAKKQTNFLDYLPIAGAAIGSVIPGAGTMAGYGVGSAAGATINTFMGDQQKSPLKLGGGGEAAAMARAAKQKSQDTLQTLQQAEASLPQLPEPLRQAYAEPIIKARMLAQRQGGMA